MLRAFVVADKPKQPIKNFARFEDWSGLVRSALVWLDEADPLTGREAIEDGDPIRVKLRALLMAWHATFKSAPATSREAVCRANETERDEEGTERPCYPAMREALEEHFIDRKGGFNSNSIGYFMRQHAGRILTGARFEAYGGNAARAAWRVVVVDSNQFNHEMRNHSDRGKHPNNPKHPNLGEHPDSSNHGWDGCHGWDVSPGPAHFAEKNNITSAANGKAWEVL